MSGPANRARRLPLGRLGLMLALAAIALGLPFVLPGYMTTNVSYALIFSIAILGLNILTGYSGQISLGHGAFIALGAYTTAVAQTKFGVNYLVTIPLAGLVCGLVGFGLGFPALRLEGIYLALATFALAVAMPSLLRKPEGLTGGSKGISVQPVVSPFSALSDDQYFYLLCLVVAAVVFLLCWNIVRGRTGRAFRAIRDGHLAASAFGVNLSAYKTLAFGISAFAAGTAGSLYGMANGYLTPDAYSFPLSVLLLVGAVIGGLGTLEGALIGGFFAWFLPLFAQQALAAVNKDVANAAPSVTQGVLLLIVMFVARQGIAGLVRTTYYRLRLWRGGRRDQIKLEAQQAEQSGPL